MNCENYINLFPDLAENKLDEPAAEHIISHLVSCSRCESEFENLFNENEIYTNFLREVEPQNNLSAQFRSKLKVEERKLILRGEPPFGFYRRLSESFAFLRLNVALTTTAILILLGLGFVLFNSFSNPKIVEDAQQSPDIPENLPLISSQRKEAETNNIASPVHTSGEPKNTEIIGLKKEVNREIAKVTAVDQTVKKIELKRSITSEAGNSLNSEEQNRIAQVQSLETDAAKQIEKVEILFRAFRNARLTEEDGRYDIDYEKRQARKLLRNNAQLKQRAEIYGTLLTEEMLYKIEPYLLDIANLDGNPSAEKVSEIKNRFKGRSIIADLQGF